MTQAANKQRINLSFYSTWDKCPEMYDFPNEIIDFGSPCLVGQLGQTVSDHKCKKVVETRCFDGNFGRGKEVEECVGFFKRWINSRRKFYFPNGCFDAHKVKVNKDIL